MSMSTLRWLIATLLALLPLASPAWAEKPAPSWQPGQVFRDCPTCPEMVVLPAGEFAMGKGDEDEARREDSVPLHRETIPQPFAIGKFEVTVAEFARFVRASGHKPDSQCHLEGMGIDYDHPNTWKQPGFELYSPEFWQQPNYPVVCVSHDDAAAFTEWLSKKTGDSYRLPTETEWEYAYRAGTTSTYYWGVEPSHEHASYEGAEGFIEDGTAKTFVAPVGAFPANGYGLHDMAGNAAEWVDECYMEGSGIPCIQWVARGGGWYFGHWDMQAHRRTLPGGTDGFFPPTAFNDVGFRIVRDLFPVERPAADKGEDTSADEVATATEREAEEVARQQAGVRLTAAYELLMVRSPAEEKARLAAAHKAWMGYRDAQCAYQTRSSAAACAAEMNLGRAVLLEDAVRLGRPKKDDLRISDDKRGTLGHLSQFAGTYRYDAVLDDPAVAKALEDLTGKEAAQLIRSDMQVIFPIDLDGSDLVLRGRKNHQGMEEEALVYVNIYKGSIRAGLVHEEKPTLYARDKEYHYIPDALRNFVRWPVEADENRKWPPQEDAPPKGVVWIR